MSQLPTNRKPEGLFMFHREILTSLSDTRLVCCHSERECEKAQFLIFELPTLLEDTEIRDLFRPLNNLAEKKLRGLYIWLI